MDWCLIKQRDYYFYRMFVNGILICMFSSLFVRRFSIVVWYSERTRQLDLIPFLSLQECFSRKCSKNRITRTEDSKCINILLCVTAFFFYLFPS